MEKEITYEYIRGLTEGEGSFSFSPNKKYGLITPSFTIGMHERDTELLIKVRNKLNLKNKIYTYDYPGNDGYNRGPRSILIVRELPSIKNVIVPLFYKKLVGNKAISFEKWMNTMSTSQKVSRKFRFIGFLYISGYYDKIHDFD